MSTIRIPEQIWDMVHSHLFSSMGEHFAFMLARWTYSLAEPVFMVYDVKLVHDGKDASCQLKESSMSLTLLCALEQR